MTPIDQHQTIQFYRSEVALWRGRGAQFWATVLLPVSLYLYIAVANLSLLHPYQWIIEVFFGLVSLKKWIYLAVMCFVFCVVAAQRVRFFSVVPEVSCGRWTGLLHLLHLSRSLHITCTALASAVLCWCFLHVLGGSIQAFSQVCSEDEEKTCLKEKHVFVIFHAFYVGFVGSIHYFTANQNLISYPVIQQNKWNQGRSGIVPTLKTSAWFVLNKLKYYYFLYYIILGCVFKNWVQSFISINLEPQPVDSILGLVDLNLFLTTWCTGTLLHFYWAMFGLLYSAYQTEPYEFVVQSGGELTERRKLVVALACHNYPLLQFQGYQDLYLLSKNSAERRGELFSLSSLGGHPHNWMSISSECLASLQKFCECVRSHNTMAMAGGNMKAVNGERQGAKDVSTLTYRGSANSTTTAEKQDAAVQPKKKESLADKVLRELGRLRVFGPVMSSQPDSSSSRQLLSHTQKYIWNVEALSHLVTASFNEDTYGVVQKSLPDIITTIVTLQEEMEKMVKLASTVSRGSGGGGEADSDGALHTTLRATLKAALYNIVNKFGSHLESIQVQPEIKKRLRHFSEYRV